MSLSQCIVLYRPCPTAIVVHHPQAEWRISWTSIEIFTGFTHVPAYSRAISLNQLNNNYQEVSYPCIIIGWKLLRCYKLSPYMG